MVWASIEYDWCPYKKRRLEHRHVHTERRPWEGIGRRWPSVGPRERLGLILPSWPAEEINPVDNLMLDFQPLEMRDSTFLFKPSSLQYFVTEALPQWYYLFATPDAFFFSLGPSKAEDGFYDICRITENKWFNNMRVIGSGDWKLEIQKGR